MSKVICHFDFGLQGSLEEALVVDDQVLTQVLINMDHTIAIFEQFNCSVWLARSRTFNL